MSGHWDWDQLEDRPLTPNEWRAREGMSPIYDEIFERMYAPKRSRWLNDAALVAAIFVVLAGIVTLAYLTGGTR